MKSIPKMRKKRLTSPRSGHILTECSDRRPDRASAALEEKSWADDLNEPRRTAWRVQSHHASGPRLCGGAAWQAL